MTTFVHQSRQVRLWILKGLDSPASGSNLEMAGLVGMPLKAWHREYELRASYLLYR
jgi:hypothetical protein